MCPINQTKITLSITKFVLPKNRAIFFRLYIIAAVHLLGKLKKKHHSHCRKKRLQYFPQTDCVGETWGTGLRWHICHVFSWIGLAGFPFFFVWSQIMRIIGPNIFRLNGCWRYICNNSHSLRNDALKTAVVSSRQNASLGGARGFCPVKNLGCRSWTLDAMVFCRWNTVKA